MVLSFQNMFVCVPVFMYFCHYLFLTEAKPISQLVLFFSSITSANCAMPVDIFAGSYFL